MTKRQRLTLNEVLDDVLSDSDDDYDDPDEPMMEGSDDEFSDLELEDDDMEMNTNNPSTPAAAHIHTSPSSTLSQTTSTRSSPAPPSPSTSIGDDSLSSPPGINISNYNQTAYLFGHSVEPPTTWSEELKPVTIRDFASRVGPAVDIPESPMETFELFYSEDLQKMIVDESNRYARQVMGDEKYRDWTKITVEELKAFFGFSILMGIDHLPSVDDYWSKDPLLHYAPIADKIPRWHFREISRYLHFVNNEDLVPRDDPMHDRLGKVRPLIDHLSSKFATLYEPSKNVAIDEAMIKFQGRLSLKQYMPMKPIKRGIKVWVLGDSSNGYFSRFDVYTGRKEQREEGLGTHVVKSLTSDLKHKYHHVYFDNYFTSFQLLEDLEKDGIYGCGTARSNRKEFPLALKTSGLKTRYKI